MCRGVEGEAPCSKSPEICHNYNTKVVSVTAIISDFSAVQSTLSQNANTLRQVASHNMTRSDFTLETTDLGN